MIVLAEPLWLAATNTYVVAPEPGGPAVVIDAPPDPESIGKLLRSHDLTPVALLLTHGHIDHAGGAGRVAAATGAEVRMHPDDDFLMQAPDEILRALFGIDPAPGEYDMPTYTNLAHGESIELGTLAFNVIQTPGHTPGHCCFYEATEGVLFSGDQLFAGSIGRTDLPGGSYPQLMESMRTRVLVLDDDVEVLPGHGPGTTLGHERRTNPFLQNL